MNIDEPLRTSTTRRAVVKAGVAVAYAAPIVAATFSLTGSGALAQQAPRVCTCVSSVTTTLVYNPTTDRCEGIGPNGEVVSRAPRDEDCVAVSP